MPASGATPWAKEDMETSVYLIQHKEVQLGTKSHGIKVAELEQLRRNAIDLDKQPMYIIDDANSKRRWVMIDNDYFTYLGGWDESS